MARFCEYCGRQIDDGECDCPGAVAAREREAMEQKAQAVAGDASAEGQAEDVYTGGQAADASNEPGQNDSQPADAQASGSVDTDTPVPDTSDEEAGSSKSKVENILGITGAEVALDLKDLFTGMFTDPIGTLGENAKRKDHASSYIIAAVLSVLTFIVIAIMGDRPLINQAIGRGTLVIFSLSAAIAIFVFKAVYAACITLWGKKYNPDLTYSSALGTFCLLGIYDIIMLLAFTFFTALSIYEISIAILFFWFIVTAIAGIVASQVLTEGKADSVIRFNLILLFIFIVLIVLSLRGIVIDMCAGAIYVVMNALAGF